jgi:hypothetical protein
MFDDADAQRTVRPRKEQAMFGRLLCAVRHALRAACRGPAMLGAAVLGASVLASASPAPVAQASLGGCGSDPVVLLSNGVTLDLNTSIDDTASDVQQVVYTLHVPSGTSVTSVTYTSGLLGPKELLRFFADNLPDTYDTATTVNTATNGIAVTTTTTAVPLSDTPASAATSGHDQQNLHVSVTP